MELGHFDNHQKHNLGQSFRFFLQDPQVDLEINKIRTLFPKITALSSNFQESEVETSPSPPSSYPSVVIRKYRIPFFFDSETEN